MADMIQLLALCGKMPPLSPIDVDSITTLLHADRSLATQMGRSPHYTEPVPALLVAIDNLHVEAVQTLVSHRADVNTAISTNGRLEAPLLCAARAGNPNIVLTLLNAGCDVQATNAMGQSAVQIAASREIRDLVSIDTLWLSCDSFEPPSQGELRQLLSCPSTRDLRVRYQDVIHHKTALHISAARGLVAAVEVLLDACADVNVRKKYRHTPLHLAACIGSCETMNVLLDARADCTATDHEGRTPLHSAAARGHVDAVGALLRAGNSIDARTARGETAADLAFNAEIRDLLTRSTRVEQVV
jgi:ankyrin repeat protein